MSSKSTNNGKEMIQEGTGIKSKDTDYVLLLNGTNQKLKLLQMDSTIKINKPRNAKKNASELKELRQESASPQQSYTPTPSSNKWLDYEMQQKNTPIVNTKPEEAEDLNFDDFDQFNDELSFFGDVKAKKLLSSPMGVSPPDVVTPGTQNVSNEKYEDEDVELDSLEDELDQVLGDEDDLEDNHLNFSGFEIDDDPLNSKKDSAANKSNSTANTTKPISLRGLAGEGDDESSSSEEE